MLKHTWTIRGSKYPHKRSCDGMCCILLEYLSLSLYPPCFVWGIIQFPAENTYKDDDDHWVRSHSIVATIIIIIIIITIKLTYYAERAGEREVEKERDCFILFHWWWSIELDQVNLWRKFPSYDLTWTSGISVIFNKIDRSKRPRDHLVFNTYWNLEIV